MMKTLSLSAIVSFCYSATLVQNHKGAQGTSGLVFRISNHNFRKLVYQIHCIITHRRAKPTHQFWFIFIEVEIPSRDDISNITAVKAGNICTEPLNCQSIFNLQGIFTAKITWGADPHHISNPDCLQINIFRPWHQFFA